MNELLKVLVERDGEEEAKAEIDVTFKNVGYDIETMSLDKAIERALSDLNLSKDFTETVTNAFYRWEADRMNGKKF